MQDGCARVTQPKRHFRVTINSFLSFVIAILTTLQYFITMVVVSHRLMNHPGLLQIHPPFKVFLHPTTTSPYQFITHQGSFDSASLICLSFIFN